MEALGDLEAAGRRGLPSRIVIAVIGDGVDRGAPMTRTFLRFSFLPFVVMLVIACPERTSIWLDSSSTAARPVFGIGRRRHRPEMQLGNLQVLDVTVCGDNGGSGMRPLWQMVGNDPYARGPVPSLIVYGKAPAPRYITAIPAQALGPGCYRASIGGTGWVKFAITSDRRIAEVDHGQ